MHRLEITGSTPEDLYLNAVRMLSVLLKGGSMTAPVELAQDAPSAAGADTASHGAVEEVREEPSSSGADKSVKRRGRTKADKTVDASTLNDPIPDLAGEKKALTLDGDIRPRLRAIQKAHAERGNDMPACVSYIQKLYGPFGIAKADQLKPEQFAEFMEASEAYLAGTA